MKNDNLDSKLAMDTMSPTARRGTARQQTAQNRSEQRFLADQAVDAGTAVLQSLHEIQHTLAQAADLRTCVKQYPWIATGSAVAAGIVAGAVFSIPQRVSGNKRPVARSAGAAPDASLYEPRPQQAGFVRGALGTALTGSVQTLLQSFIAAAIVAKEVDPVEETSRRPGSSSSVVQESLTQ